MRSRRRGRAIGRVLRNEWQQLATFQATRRRWPMPLAAALASGLPLLAGVAAGHVGAGLAGSLGGLVFLYLPETPMHHRMVTLMACGFAMAACFALGLGVQVLDLALVRARFFDTVLGCVVGLLGGVCLHSPRLRGWVERPLRALVPQRLRRRIRNGGMPLGGDMADRRPPRR